jgi:hypothetical protein
MVSKTTISILNSFNKNINNGVKHLEFHRLLSITICVNYSDYLYEGIFTNSKFIDKMIVVTDKDDIETINLCKNFKNVEVLISDRLHKDNLSFNKSAMINHALDVFGSMSEWILILDADVKICDFRNDLNNLDKNCLYGVRRDIYKTKDDYQKGKAQRTDDYGMGYFQLFSTKSKPWINGVRYKENTGRSDNFKGPDKWFSNNWKVKELNMTVDHLGPHRVNWGKRRSKKW